MKTLNERVKEAAELAEKKKSIPDIATTCGVSRQSVYAWRNGESANMRGATLVELAELSGLSPRWIMKGKGPKHALTEDEVTILHAFSIFDEEARHQWLLVAKDFITREAASRKTGIVISMTEWRQRIRQPSLFNDN